MRSRVIAWGGSLMIALTSAQAAGPAAQPAGEAARARTPQRAAAATAPVASRTPQASAPFALRWEVERNEFTAQVPDGRSHSVFELRATGDRGLPAQGWALYFTCLSEAETGPVPGGLQVEQVVGTLYRVRPAAGFAPVPAGGTLAIRIVHPEVVTQIDKGPQGPYLVFDEAPTVGLPITDFRAPIQTRPEQLDRGPDKRLAQWTPEARFERQARILPVAPEALPPVFPPPLQWQRGQGQLHWMRAPVVQAPAALKREAAQVTGWLAPYFADPKADPAQPAVRLSVGPVDGQASPEAYELRVDAQGVSLRGATAAGVARGLQSLRDLLPLRAPAASAVAGMSADGASAAAAGVTLPALHVVDAPRFGHRGLMIDVARSFHPPATLHRVIELMARLKLNVLHLHLTDDEGWRLEIRGLPELTGIGARRGHVAPSATGADLPHLPPAHGSGPLAGTLPGSGHYSRAEYIALLRHAAERHIEVIPEIEMPGHARAAVRAMETRALRMSRLGRPDADRYRLNDPQDRSVYRSPQLHRDHVIDPGLESTYTFIGHVVAEVVALHREAGVPLRRLHVGADELARGAWQGSPASQKAMQRLGLDSTEALWDHFYGRVEAILRRHRLTPAGWEELGARVTRLHGRHMLIPNPAFVGRGFDLFVWNNVEGAEDLANRLANAGYRTVLAPAMSLYFDMAPNGNPDEHGVNWANYVDLDTVFDFLPFDMIRRVPTDPASRLPGKDGLTDYGRRQILGLQGTLFSEIAHDEARLQHLIMPRLLALAERAWVADPAWARAPDAAQAGALHAQDWSRFVHQVGRQVLPRLDAEGPALNYRIPPPGLKRIGGALHTNHPLPGFVLRYTTDGSEPTLSSPVVSGPIAATGKVRVAAFNTLGRRSASASLDPR